MRNLLCFLSPLFFLNSAAQDMVKRSLIPTDVYLLKHVSEPQISPDGKWVVYTVSTVDTAKDKMNSNLWMVSWDGKQNVQLTYSEDGESNPKWSPNGKYISFIAARNGDKIAQ